MTESGSTGAQQALDLRNSGYTSAVLLSTAANFIMNRGEAATYTYRIYLKPRAYGQLKLKLWHSNAVDSTWDQGADALGGEPGGDWRIEAAYLSDGGMEPDGQVVEGSAVPVTFGGEAGRQVLPAERWWSDTVHIEIPEGHYLCLSWTLSTVSSGKSYPYNVEQMLATGFEAPGNRAGQSSADGFVRSENRLVLPSFIGYQATVQKQMVFFGDSITQGVRTAKDQYQYWAAEIAAGLGTDYGHWNIGSGWGRAYDAADGGPWLYKAMQGDEVVIALGVNDLDIGQRTAGQLLDSLQRIVTAIRSQHAEGSIVLCTVPPFNFEGEKEAAWREVNAAIRSGQITGVDRIFDLAAVLSLPVPAEHRLQPRYMSSEYDPHPNGKAGQDVAAAFLAWYQDAADH
ncbi:SGNH/GDSL hydrolase family protein [Paenibacillus sp. JX-17]|uniref:SGNH/GDSL hydrolase family protein n=1 Tax=Paenibacillus lacisoli TaxID=3064525 RepID=A0ABT9CCL9_9BACL|nr:SGNH/GDSL hydrolase family protein [Paenibacillus sp. JX-17]MDO7907010.1 SGNH/GDSL hydrolase family protein [Paenibacillus sp. JX-17]